MFLSVSSELYSLCFMGGRIMIFDYYIQEIFRGYQKTIMLRISTDLESEESEGRQRSCAISCQVGKVRQNCSMLLGYNFSVFPFSFPRGNAELTTIKILFSSFSLVGSKYEIKGLYSRRRRYWTKQPARVLDTIGLLISGGVFESVIKYSFGAFAS